MANNAQPAATPQLPPAMKAEISKNIPDGTHTGTISRTKYEKRGDQQFPYLDVFITEDESGVELKVGFAANKVTTGSAIGRLLTRMGFDVEKAALAGRDVDWAVLTGKVQFTTSTEETAKGRFARIDQDSIVPAAAAPARRR